MPPAPYPNRQPTDRLSQTYTMGTNANPVRVAHPFSLFNGPLDGALDEVRLYDRALSGPEIMTLTQARDYSYDAKGNLTGDRVWGYQYDHENRLTVATNGAVRVDYRYDAFGRQIERRTSGATVSTNRLYYAGWQLIAEYNGSGTLQRKYVYGPGIDEPVRMRFTGGVGTNYYYHADGLGSVTEVTDRFGLKAERYSYDVYGTPTIYNAAGSVISTPSTGNRLLFTGRDRDPDTTLYNYRYRYYSPSLGRFVQVDPWRLSGTGANGITAGFGLDLIGADPETEAISEEPVNQSNLRVLYEYAGNDPVNFADPSGLWKLKPPKPSGFWKVYKPWLGLQIVIGLIYQKLLTQTLQKACDQMKAQGVAATYVFPVLPIQLGAGCLLVEYDPCTHTCVVKWVFGLCTPGFIPPGNPFGPPLDA